MKQNNLYNYFSNNLVNFSSPYDSLKVNDFTTEFINFQNNFTTYLENVNNFSTFEFKKNDLVFDRKNTQNDVTSFLDIYQNSFPNIVLENKLLSSQTNDFVKSDEVNVSTEKPFQNDLIDEQKNNQTKIIEDEILEIIRSEDYEEGMTSKIEEYMEQDFSKYELEIIRKAAQRISIENLSNTKIINGILRMISSRTYDEMYPEGQYIGLALLQNKNITLREKGIQLFEYWKSKKGVKILESLECDQEWLQNYVNKIIDYLNKYGSN